MVFEETDQLITKALQKISAEEREELYGHMSHQFDVHAGSLGEENPFDAHDLAELAQITDSRYMPPELMWEFRGAILRDEDSGSLSLNEYVDHLGRRVENVRQQKNALVFLTV